MGGRQPRRGAVTLDDYVFVKFVCQNERIGTLTGERSGCPPWIRQYLYLPCKLPVFVTLKFSPESPGMITNFEMLLYLDLINYLLYLIAPTKTII